MKAPFDDYACPDLNAVALPAYETFIRGSVYRLVWSVFAVSTTFTGPLRGTGKLTATTRRARIGVPGIVRLSAGGSGR
jgi:hypothetical protein